MKYIRLLKDFLKNQKLRCSYNTTSSRSQNSKQLIVYMADGKIHHGGLSDRLCGIISTFCFCKEHNIDFKIYFKHPFDLSIFLQPNEYNWLIHNEDISYNIHDSLPIYISHDKNWVEQRRKAQIKLMLAYKQIHVYTNMRYYDTQEFSYYFNLLFRPSDLLRSEIDYNIAKLPPIYISLTFRFQQLLGDFVEGNFPIIKSEEEKQVLIDRCLDCIEKVHQKHINAMKVLVTSDSTTFLSIAAERLSYVYTIPGRIAHPDFSNESVVIDMYKKSFLDLFLISKAEKIYVADFAPLYATTFPYTASFITGRPCEKIV